MYEIDSSTKLGQSRKLNKMWKGPCFVVKVISPSLYQIKGTKEHHDRLKLCLERDVLLWVKQQRKFVFEGKGDTEQGNSVAEIPDKKTVTCVMMVLKNYLRMQQQQLPHQKGGKLRNPPISLILSCKIIVTVVIHS